MERPPERETSMSLALGSVPLLRASGPKRWGKATKLSAPPIGWVFGRKHPHRLGPEAMGRFPEQETCLFLALGASPSVEHFYRFPYLFLSRAIPFHFSIMSWDSQTLKAMKRIGMRKKSSMHFIVLKVCKSQNKKEKWTGMKRNSLWKE